MDSREAKIKLLSRLNRERAATPAMLKGLSKALNAQVEETTLLDSSQVDALLGSFRAGYADSKERGASSYRRFFHREQLPVAQHLTDCLAHHLGSEQVYLLTKFNGDERGVVVEAATLFSRVGPVIDFDGDSLCALSKDGTQGVLIDHNPDDEQTYELTVWGDRWPLLVLARDHVTPHNA
jgi:hypothetical protein